ncbi:DUF4331 domain-containing protein [Actinoplanes sp. TBRC 11911]|uniref:DUF4331 family protein n=1 Tax=Actinoplanes sp. TBRC 11911 TaxID=2729386 RepID=UPI00145EA24F|nr:DUF4331 family protein [Actinoplanes sp. TBRC 11911]NMO55358.1 DUF4331 domain-containing protein [Actinoplanes sp. TBRC 11911]
MSHHLDSPEARKDARLDITDLYVFRGDEGTVFVMNVNHSLATEVTGVQAPAGYHPDARYEFNIDTDGDSVENLVYRFTFGPLDGSGEQQLTLRVPPDPIDASVTDDNVETTILQGRTGETLHGPDGVRVWTGPAGDPFWIDPVVLAAAGEAVAHGTRFELGEWTPALATNAFAGHTVYTIVLEVPDGLLAPLLAADQRFTTWALTSLATDAGGWRPINRAGHPMIHPLFAQHDEQLGDRLNATKPVADVTNYAEHVTEAVAAVVSAYGNVDDPRAYGAAFAARFLPNVLPYTLGTAASYSFLGINGRSLVDNVPDVMFSLATNTPLSIGLDRDAVARPPKTDFPYLLDVD